MYCMVTWFDMYGDVVPRYGQIPLICYDSNFQSVLAVLDTQPLCPTLWPRLQTPFATFGIRPHLGLLTRTVYGQFMALIQLSRVSSSAMTSDVLLHLFAVFRTEPVLIYS